MLLGLVVEDGLAGGTSAADVRPRPSYAPFVVPLCPFVATEEAFVDCVGCAGSGFAIAGGGGGGGAFSSMGEIVGGGMSVPSVRE